MYGTEHLNREDRLETLLVYLVQVANTSNHYIRQILEGQQAMANSLDALTAEVAQDTTVMASAVTLIQGLADAIKSAGTDPVALANLVSSLESSRTALAQAITANTPATPPPPPPAG